MTIECITMPQTTTRFTVFFFLFFSPSIGLSSLLWIHSFSSLLFLQVITNAARLYTDPTMGISMHLHTKNKRERESSQWSISAQKTIFFFYLRLKTLTRHPLSGNEMIEYCYCKTRPLKILTVCSRDTPEQDTTSLVKFFSSTLVVCFLKYFSNSAAFTQHKQPDSNSVLPIKSWKKLDFTWFARKPQTSTTVVTIWTPSH